MLDNNFISHKGRDILKYETRVVDGEDVLIPTEAFKKISKDKLRMASIRSTNLSPDSFQYSLYDYVGKVSIENVDKLRAYVRDFEDRFKSVHLYLWSENNSTQKSTMAKAMVKDLFLAGYSCYFMTMDMLVKALQSESFDKKALDLVTTLREVDFLVIDDAFDKHKVTLYKSQYQLPFIDSFLRERLELKKRATIFTSNFAVQDIEVNFERHLRKLVERNCVILEFNDGINDFDLSKLFD